MTTKTVTFSVDPQLFDELGQRLVTHDHVALAELIKNSYDADATLVSVTFARQLDGSIHLVVADDGHGMTLDAIENRWMRVATTDKIEFPVSPQFRRPRTGSKGIGRFAVLRLSAEVVLDTVAVKGHNRLEQTRVAFDWDRVSSVRDIKDLTFVAESKVKNGTAEKTGTVLTFKRLRKEWTESEILKLKRDLSEVVGHVPKHHAPGAPLDPGFDVQIDGDGEGAGPVSKTVSEEFLDAGWARLRGRVAPGGQRWQLSLKSAGAPRESHSIALPDSLRDLGRNIDLDVSWFPQKKDMWSNPKLATQKAARAFLAERAGVRVFLNGHRVFPYGDKLDDWLLLEHMQASRSTGFASAELSNLAEEMGLTAARPLLDSPRPQRIIGRIAIKQSPSGPLIPTTDRMGFVDNASFRDFRSLIRQSLQWMTLLYTSAKIKRNEQRLTDALQGAGIASGSDVEPAIAALGIIREKLGAGGSTVSLSPHDVRILQSAANAVEARTRQVSHQMERLEYLASTAPLVFAFGHEVRRIVLQNKLVARDLSEQSGRLPGGVIRKAMMEVGSNLEQASEELLGVVNLVGLMAVKSKSDIVGSQSVVLAVERASTAFRGVAQHYHIDLVTDIPDTLVTSPIREVALLSLIVNALSNAIKAVIAQGGASRSIRVSGHQSGSAVVLLVDDTGVGVDVPTSSLLFQPLLSDPDNTLYPRLRSQLDNEAAEMLGTGTGLGLSIIKSILTRAGGRVAFTEPPVQWSTRLEMVIP